MSTRLPPRREPRVLALVRSRKGFHYATADPWEIRATGSISCHEQALTPAVARLARREKPTLLVSGSPSLRGPVRRAGKHLALAVGKDHLPIPPAFVAEDLYPELRMRAPTAALVRVATLAIAAVLYAQAPSRRYAPRRNDTVQHTA
jgi:hypothetical protein